MDAVPPHMAAHGCIAVSSCTACINGKTAVENGSRAAINGSIASINGSIVSMKRKGKGGGMTCLGGNGDTVCGFQYSVVDHLFQILVQKYPARVHPISTRHSSIVHFSTNMQGNAVLVVRNVARYSSVIAKSAARYTSDSTEAYRVA